MKVPAHLTGEQARVLMQVLELLIDTLIELYTGLQRQYAPWGEPGATDDVF